MIYTAPSPRRHLFLPPNLGLGSGQVLLTLVGAEFSIIKKTVRILSNSQHYL